MVGTIKVLVVDDDPEVLELIAEFLDGLSLESRLARDGDEALRIFRTEYPPLVITDLKMPGIDGLEIVRAIKEASPQTEVLIITGHADLDSAIEAVRQGAFDYVQKPFDLDTLGRRVIQALERHGLVVQAETLRRDLEQRVDARTKALEESRRRVRALFNGIAEPLVIVDETLTIVVANEEAAAHSSMPAKDLVGRLCYQTMWAREAPCEKCPVVTTFATGQAALGTTIRDLGPRGGRRDFDLRSYPMEIVAGARKEAVEHIRDVTEQKRAEEERGVFEAQRRVDEAIHMIGELAAGSAHDFNTVLTLIRGYAHFLLEGTRDDDPRRADAERIQSTAERGQRLVRELMALGTLGLGEVHSVNVASVVHGMVPAVRSLLGDHVALTVHVASGLWPVRANPAHIERVIMNLVVNARDSMLVGRAGCHGATLAVEIGNVEFSETSPTMSIEGVPPGPYVMLAVRDTGSGMPPEVQSRVFEPFFTTKAAGTGTGTGLGLATVAWIVKWYQGRVVCESEPERGTVFRVYLPRSDEE